jgi:hypothetical protein
MNRFAPVQRDVRENQIYRDTLLAQPSEFFRQQFGFVPDLMEKVRLVEKMIQMVGAAHIFTNDVYTVRMRNAAPFIHLDIARRDGESCKSWWDFQQIKNELVGPECEAVELFPAESRLVNTSNQYHLWVNPDASFRFPLGYQRRIVLDSPVVYRGKAGQEGPISEGRTLNNDNSAKGAADHVS